MNCKREATENKALGLSWGLVHERGDDGSQDVGKSVRPLYWTIVSKEGGNKAKVSIY